MTIETTEQTLADAEESEFAAAKAAHRLALRAWERAEAAVSVRAKREASNWYRDATHTLADRQAAERGGYRKRAPYDMWERHRLERLALLEEREFNRTLFEILWGRAYPGAESDEWVTLNGRRE